ncbi:TPA: hypothetical protein PXJ37_002399 [Yersinia enterocolitica]|nr:hypothetical protein [Yersinia enterocolitica]HDL6612820.1 hypothetical protein [Yersinia enterocolitica]HDL6670717.1 hypothetical protein [Yersinia enterocolitica]HDL6726500.1 hypothetical protein [Yersinia enterocolitica]HDL6735657.1 hypothetical protein [Yersinia enterocolitica]
MAHEITLEKAAEMARQAELVCLLLESHPHELQSGDVSAIACLLAKLTGHAGGWLREEMAQRAANRE